MNGNFEYILIYKDNLTEKSISELKVNRVYYKYKILKVVDI